MKNVYVTTFLLFVLIILSVLFCPDAFSQTADKKWNIGLHGGINQYNGDLSNDFYKTDQAFYGFGGISFSRYISTRFDLNLLVTKGDIGHHSDKGDFFSGLSTATLNFRFNITGPDAIVRPYLFVGGGILMFSVNPTADKSKTDFAAPSAGAGLNFRLGESIMFQLQETFYVSGADDKDGVSSGSNDIFLQHTAGFTFNFGNKNDADKDGVADRKDKCSETPAGVQVDVNGCPLDKDKDEVADYLDACPDVKGLKTLKGCPDKDEDGVTDKEDECPDVKGTIAFKGCPDTDKDGVPDNLDKCADTKPEYKVDINGCPMDKDKDGVLNEDDACPDSAGTAAMKGCPDSDGDSIADNVDRCPEVAGTKANHGCPEMKVEDVKKITQIASKIFFETNSDKLKVASLVQLDELAEILKKYPEANLTIEGHTDDVGKDDYNLQLSQKRTDSVKSYLMSKGIFESRLNAVGYGETRPIADNKTSTGRAKNRRVELKTEY
jgi:OOP family OmpA-OmpF porin